MDNKKTKGNQIEGTMSVDSDGYLITSIPFDSNFQIQIDGKDTKICKVNTAFLGCRITKGNHQIKITYHAPGGKAGKILALFGVLMTIIYLLMSRTHGILYGKNKREGDSNDIQNWRTFDSYRK